MSAWHAVELRWVALLRARLSVVGITGVGCLALAGSLGARLEGEARTDAAIQLLSYASLLLTLLVSHGMVAGELRSGVALLWLQKPVRPVAFYACRGAEVSILAMLVVACVSGAAAAIFFLAGAPDAALTALEATPLMLLLSLSLSVMVFGFSGWSLPLDSVLAVGVCFATFAWLFERVSAGTTPAHLPWFFPPVDELRVLVLTSRGEPVEGLGRALLGSGRFLLFWVGFGVAGLFVSTRSPLPKEVAR